MGLFDFQVPSVEQAIACLTSGVKMAENHGDRIAAGRCLMPVASPEEIAANKAYLAEQRAKNARGAA